MKNKIKLMSLCLLSVLTLTNQMFATDFFGNLGRQLNGLANGDTEFLAIENGLTKAKDQQQWFSPAPIIKNYSLSTDKNQSRLELKQPSVNYLTHPDFGSYSGDNLDGNNLMDENPPILTIENIFFKTKNGPQEYLTIYGKAFNKYSNKIGGYYLKELVFQVYREHDKGESELKPITVKIEAVDNNNNPLLEIYNQELETNSQSISIAVGEDIIIDKNKGLINFKLSYKIDGIDKTFYNIIQLDIFTMKDYIIAERLSLIGENVNPKPHPDDVKRIKVYLSELTNMSPYSYDMITRNNDFMKKETDVRRFLNYYAHSILYKDHALKNYNAHNQNGRATYIPTKGYLANTSGVTEDMVEKLLNKRDDGHEYTLIATKKINGEITKQKEKVIKDDSIKSFINNTFLIPNYTNSLFLKRWNQMVSSVGFRSGGIVLFEKGNNQFYLEPRKLYDTLKEKGNVNNYKSQYVEPTETFEKHISYMNNVKKLEAMEKYNDESIIGLFGKLQYNLYGEDNIMDEYMYTYMSFNEYAATWGLTAKEAKKLFEIDENNRMVWKIDGMRNYLSYILPHDNNFIDIDEKGNFSNKEIKGKTNNLSSNEEIIKTITDNTDTLTILNSYKSPKENLIEKYNDESNKYLIDLLRYTERFGKKSIERILIERQCDFNAIGFKGADCDKIYWNPEKYEVKSGNRYVQNATRKITPLFEGFVHNPKEYIIEKPEDKSYRIQKDLYSNKINKIYEAIQEGAFVNSKKIEGYPYTALDFYLMHGINNEEGFITKPAIMYMLIKAGAKINDEALEYMENAIKQLKHKRGINVLNFFSNTDDEVITYLKGIHQSLINIKNNPSTLKEEINKAYLNEYNKAKKPSDLPNYVSEWFIYDILDKNINDYIFNNQFNLLQLASIGNNKEIITKILKKKDVNVNLIINNKYKESSLQMLSRYGTKDMIELLIENGADIEYKSTEGFNSLQLAINDNKFENVKVLVENGANVNETIKGFSCLMLVGMNTQNIKMFDFLVENGADIEYKSTEGKTVYQLANQKIKNHIDRKYK